MQKTKETTGSKPDHHADEAKRDIEMMARLSQSDQSNNYSVKDRLIENFELRSTDVIAGKGRAYFFFPFVLGCRQLALTVLFVICDTTFPFSYRQIRTITQFTLSRVNQEEA